MSALDPRLARAAGTVTDHAWQGLSRSADQTLAVGQAIAAFTKPGDLVALVGELGAGKTQLVRGLVRGLGIDAAAVSSPTFVLMQQYGHSSGQPTVIHVDAYRLQGDSEADSIGWGSDLFSGTVVVVEWADRLADLLPADRLQVELTHEDIGQRYLSVMGHGVWRERMPRLCQALSGLVDAA